MNVIAFPVHHLAPQCERSTVSSAIFQPSIFSEGWKGLPNPARGEEMQLDLWVFTGEREYECDNISGSPTGFPL